MPTVGPATIANLVRHGARMMVIEAGKTVLLDREVTIAAADKAGIAIDSRV